MMEMVQHQWNKIPKRYTSKIDFLIERVIYRLNKEYIGCKESFQIKSPKEITGIKFCSPKNALSVAEIRN